MDLKQLVESKYKGVLEKTDHLLREWTPFIGAVNDYVKSERGKELSLYEKRNMAMCLDNAFTTTMLRSKANGIINEATTESDIAFLGVQLPVIAALLPSLALNDVALVQSLDRRTGGVFYLDVKYGSNKGGVEAGNTMISSRTGHARSKAERTYAATRVVREVLNTSTSDTVSTEFSGTLAYSPGVFLRNGTIVITNSADSIVAINKTTGSDMADIGSFKSDDEKLEFTFTADGLYQIKVTSGGSIPTGGLYVSYNYQYDKVTGEYNDRTGVPEANVEVTMENIEAIDFPLRTQYSVGAALDLMKAHGINLENELTKYLGNEVRWTIDQYGLDIMDEASRSGDAATAITPWNAAVNSGQEWLFKKDEFIDRFEEGNVNIVNKTLRACANFIVVGMNVARVIRQMRQFTPVAGFETSAPTGPVKIGTIDGRTVVMNPFLKDITVGGNTVRGVDRYFMGYRGSDYLHAGFIYAPYIPLMTTPTITTSDLYSQKGFLSAAGFKLINNGMFTHGYITNLGQNAKVTLT